VLCEGEELTLEELKNLAQVEGDTAKEASRESELALRSVPASHEELPFAPSVNLLLFGGFESHMAKYT
jgi:hypothetical protein